MKRLLSLILSITILVCSFATLGVSADASSYNSVEEIMAGLGIIDAEYESSRVISRAEFAGIICKVLGVDVADYDVKEWEDYVYDGTVAVNTLPFSDVDVTHPNYAAIKEVYLRGYMKGITDSHFAPNYDMTDYAAVKVFVEMLGYSELAEALGGWPNGYILAAQKKGLLKNISVSEKGILTYGKALQFVYAAMDIVVMDFAGLGTDGEQYLEGNGTFLTNVMELDMIEGTITDNGVTSIYGKTSISEEQMVIGGVTVTVADNCAYAKDFIGREVTAYYKNNKDAKKELVYVYTIDDSSVVSFNIDDFVSINSSGITYVSENGKTKTEKLHSNANVIYNDVFISKYDKSIFDFAFGDVTLVKTEGSTADLVIINDYKIGVVTKLLASTNTLYCDNVYGDLFVKSIALEEGAAYDKVIIRDQDGKAVSSSAITPGSVVSVKKSSDNSCITIIVSTKRVGEFEFDTITEEDNNLVLSGENGTYIFKNYANIKNKPLLEYGKAYKLYFTHNDELVWIDADVSAGKKIGILLQTSKETGLESEYLAKIYNSDGQFDILTFGKNIELNNESKKTENVFDEITAARNQAVLYTTDADVKVLKSITLPLDYAKEDTENRGWYHVTPKIRLKQAEGETDAQWKAYRDANKLQFQTNGSTFKKFVVYDKSITNIFTMPDDENYYGDEKKFSVNKFSFSNSASYMFNAYAKDKNAISPDVMLMCQAAKGSGSIKNKVAILIERISKGVDQEGETVNIIKGYEFNYDKSTVSACTYSVDEDVIFLGPGEVAEELNPDTSNILTDGASKMSDLDAGDIIRVELNSYGAIVGIRTAYDMSTGVAFASGQSSTGVSGYLTDAAGNISAGYPMYVWNDYLRISEVSPDDMDLTDPNQLKTLMGVRTKPACVYVVSKVNGKLTIAQGTLDDIATYEDTNDASLCDKVASLTYWGLPVGTVVYKK